MSMKMAADVYSTTSSVYLHLATWDRGSNMGGRDSKENEDFNPKIEIIVLAL